LLKEVVKILAEITSGLSGEGAAVVLVEQNVEMALEVADRVCVLVGGAIFHEGPKSDLSSSDISEFYLH
jgi:branched-chain amino acid transport system ATP-binding protein